MLSKDQRFTGRQFEYLRRKMKSFRSGPFLFLFGPDKQRSKVSVVISKKVEKTAVGRNRYRRQMYEVFRSELLDCLSKPTNIICLYKGSQITHNAAEMRQHVGAFAQFLNQK